MRRRLRRRRWIIGALWLALLAGGGAVIARADRSPVLSVVCSSIEDLCREWGRDFTQRTGLRVSVVRMSSGQALARIARGDGEFDVWHGGPSEFYAAAAQRGLLQAYRPAGSDAIPASLRSPDATWTGVYRGMLGFCSNTRVLNQLGVAIPHTWDDLLNPRLRGQVSVPDPQTSGTGYSWLWTQAHRAGIDDGLRYVEQLDPNVLQYTLSGTAPAGIAGRGEAAVAVTFTQHCVKAHDQGFTDLAVSYPTGPTGSETGAVAIVRATGKRAAAQRYVDYAVSRPAQELGDSLDSAQLPTLPDAARDPRLELPATSSVLSEDPATAAAERADLLDAFARRVRT